MAQRFPDELYPFLKQLELLEFHLIPIPPTSPILVHLLTVWMLLCGIWPILLLSPILLLALLSPSRLLLSIFLPFTIFLTSYLNAYMTRNYDLARDRAMKLLLIKTFKDLRV